MGGEGYGIWQGGSWLGGHDAGRRMPSLSITKFLTALAVVRAIGAAADPGAATAALLAGLGQVSDRQGGPQAQGGGHDDG